MTDTFSLETLSQCPLCGNSTGLRQLLESSDYESSHTGDYPIISCSACGLAFTNPRPTEASIPQLYAARSTPDFALGSKGIVQRLRNWVARRYLLRRLPKNDSIPLDVLDFGCGDGTLTAGVSQITSTRTGTTTVTAVDFHDQAPHLLTDCGSSVRYLDYWTWRSNSNCYDVVFLRHVLEHHPEPLRLISELRESLKPDGVLHIEVPNRRSMWAQIFGRYYVGYYVPRHLMHFDGPSLHRVLSDGGLRVIEFRKSHTPFIGRSIGYALSMDIDNLGVFGLATYPLQVALDTLFGRSTTLRIAAKR
jgi:SAM-dependent methyltransferase